METWDDDSPDGDDLIDQLSLVHNDLAAKTPSEAKWHPHTMFGRRQKQPSQ